MSRNTINWTENLLNCMLLVTVDAIFTNFTKRVKKSTEIRRPDVTRRFLRKRIEYVVFQFY